MQKDFYLVAQHDNKDIIRLEVNDFSRYIDLTSFGNTVNIRWSFNSNNNEIQSSSGSITEKTIQDYNLLKKLVSLLIVNPITSKEHETRLMAVCWALTQKGYKVEVK